MMIYKMENFNSMTKYPSIETYHKLGEKGRLTTELQFPLPSGVTIHGTEKVDGTNSRISMIMEPDGFDFFIGSREEWFTAMGDRVYNGNMGVVDAYLSLDIENSVDAMHIAMEYMTKVSLPYGLYTVYGEVYGGNINAYKQYTSTKTMGVRVFDISYIPLDRYKQLEMMPRETVANWRDNGGQIFLNAETKAVICELMDLDLVPDLFTMKSEDLPETLEETYEFLMKYKETKAGIDAHGDAEGIVVRDAQRGFITKIREEDYRRTLANAGVKRK